MDSLIDGSNAWRRGVTLNGHDRRMVLSDLDAALATLAHPGPCVAHAVWLLKLVRDRIEPPVRT
jgi:hypothetical protein